MVSTVTRPVIIHRFEGGRCYVLKWMLWMRWHSFEKVKAVFICTARYRRIQAFLATLSILSWPEWLQGCRAFLSQLSVYSIYSLSPQPVRLVSISRWQVMVHVVNAHNTATQRPEQHCPAPVTPASTAQETTHQQLRVPVSTKTSHTKSPSCHVPVVSVSQDCWVPIWKCQPEHPLKFHFHLRKQL